MIQVGAFFAVDLDANEVVVHEPGDCCVFETFVGHDVAPMARGIADAQQDGPVPRFCIGEGLGGPGAPIHGIVLVLPQIGAGGVGKRVGHGKYICRSTIESTFLFVRTSGRKATQGAAARKSARCASAHT